MRVTHKADRAALRAQEMPSLAERVAALEEIILANPGLAKSIPAPAQAVLDRIAAVKTKYPERN